MSLAEQAATWVVAQGGEDWAPGRQRVLEQWLQASPLHRAAYERARENWLMAAQLRRLPELLPGPSSGPPRRPRAHDAGGPAPLSRMRPHSRQAHPAQAGRARRLGLLATLAVVVLVGGLLSWSDGDPYTAVLADHRSTTGEIRDVRLPDGSAVRLDAASAIAVHYDQNERRVELLKGRALFVATPAAATAGRPFVVATAEGRTRALGTQFMVERRARQTVVTGIEHRVEVSTTDMLPAAAVILAPGQSVRYDARGLGAVEQVPLAQAQSWEKGVLLFDDVPLRDVLAQLQRYQGGRIALRDDAQAQRRISAAVPTQDVGAGLRVIASELGLRVLRLPLLTLLY